jgi:hypothetical protein
VALAVKIAPRSSGGSAVTVSPQSPMNMMSAA